MSKLLTMSIVILGTLLLLNLVGFQPPITGLAFKAVGNGTATSNGTLIDYTNDSGNTFSNFQNFSLWQSLLTILLAVGTVGIVIAGLFGRTPQTEYIIAPITVIFGTALLVDLGWILTKLWSYGMPFRAIGFIVIVPVCVGFIISLIEWWRFGY